MSFDATSSGQELPKFLRRTRAISITAKACCCIDLAIGLVYYMVSFALSFRILPMVAFPFHISSYFSVSFS